MLDDNKLFIGREKQIDRFKEILRSDPKEERIIFVYDSAEDPERTGGIGKTWLLNKFIISIVSSDEFKDKYLVIDKIFDFLEPINQDRFSRHLNIVGLINEKLPTNHFQPFWDLVSKYYTQQISIEGILDCYYECYNEFCRDTGKTVIRFYDNFEKNPIALNYTKGKYRFISDEIIDNSLFVICGRFGPDYDTPVWEGRKDKIEEMPLSGFSISEASKYFKGVEITDLPKSDIEEINNKAEGRPILLALAADLINGKIKTIEDLKRVSGEKFKEQLVSFIIEFAKPTDIAVLAMSHLKHRCDKSILKTYLGDQVDNYDSFFEQLLELSFVRPITLDRSVVVLHDEMQAMVSRYIYPILDAPDMKIRKDLSNIVVEQYYEKGISNREGEIVQKIQERKLSEAQTLREEIASLKSEMWYHKLFLDYVNNFDIYFFDLFDPALEDGKLDYCLLLISQMEDLDNLIHFKQYYRNKVGFRKIRVYSELLGQTGNPFYFESARELINDLEKEIDKAKWENRFSGTIWLEIGILHYHIGKLQDAEQFFKKSVEALKLDPEQKNLDVNYILGKAYNWYGYNQYNQGFFSESLELLNKAEEYIQKANELIKDADISDILKRFRQRQILYWLAQIWGNLCRINYEIGELEIATRYGELSLTLRKKLNKPIEIIRGLNSLGLVYARSGRFFESQRLYVEAENLLKTNPHKVLEARIKINHATSLFKRDQFSHLFETLTPKEFETESQSITVRPDDFGQAQDLLMNVIDQMLPLLNRELIIAYLNLGELLIIKKKWSESKKELLSGEEVAKKRNDSYTLMNIMQRIVLVNYYEKNEKELVKSAVTFENEIKNLENPEETAKYIIRFYITIGNFYFEKAQHTTDEKQVIDIIKTAFLNYTKSCYYSKNYAIKLLQLTYDVYYKRFSFLSESKIKLIDQIINNLKDSWQQEGLELYDFEKITKLYHIYKRIDVK